MTNVTPFLPRATEQAHPPVIAERHGPASVPRISINWGLILGIAFCIGVYGGLFWLLAWKLGGNS